MTIRAVVCMVFAAVALAGCSGIDLGDNPLREVPKQTGPLTALPTHLKDGSR